MFRDKTERKITINRCEQGLEVGCLFISPPLDTLEEFQAVCDTAHDVDPNTAPRATQRDFEQSQLVDSTQLRFVGRSERDLVEAGCRVANLLAAHQVPTDLDTHAVMV